jgi:hypothetical protein
MTSTLIFFKMNALNGLRVHRDTTNISVRKHWKILGVFFISAVESDATVPHSIDCSGKKLGFKYPHGFRLGEHAIQETEASLPRPIQSPGYFRTASDAFLYCNIMGHRRVETTCEDAFQGHISGNRL